MKEPHHVIKYHMICEQIFRQSVVTLVRPLLENPLSLSLQLHRVEWLAGSFFRTSCSTITGDHTDLYTWWPWTMLSISWCIISSSQHKFCQLPLEIISKKTFDWELEVCNKCRSCLVAGVKSCWKQINTQAIIWGNTVCMYVYVHVCDNYM